MTENEAIKSIQNDLEWHNKELKPAYKECLIMAIQALEEIQQYRAIGTVEELKKLKEKQIPKKPRFYAHNYYCIGCGNLVGNNEFEWQRFLYCDGCGQKIDWQ